MSYLPFREDPHSGTSTIANGASMMSPLTFCEHCTIAIATTIAPSKASPKFSTRQENAPLGTQHAYQSKHSARVGRGPITKHRPCGNEYHDCIHFSATLSLESPLIPALHSSFSSPLHRLKHVMFWIIGLRDLRKRVTSLKRHLQHNITKNIQ